MISFAIWSARFWCSRSELCLLVSTSFWIALETSPLKENYILVGERLVILFITNSYGKVLHHASYSKYTSDWSTITMHACMHACIDGWMDGWIDGWMDR